MGSLPDCRQCKHATPGFHQWLCTRFKDPMATSWRRDPRNECGLYGVFFELKEKKK